MKDPGVFRLCRVFFLLILLILSSEVDFTLCLVDLSGSWWTLTRPPENAPSLVMDSDHRQVRKSVENGGGRPARYALARRRVVIFFGWYYISLSYEEKRNPG